MKIEWKTCFRVGISAFLLFLCIHYWQNAADLISTLFSGAAPLLIGCVIAYLINILMSFYERHYFPRKKTDAILKSRRPVCMLAAFLTLITVVALLIVLVVPELASCVQIILDELPDAIDSMIAWLDTLNLVPEDIAAALASVDWRAKINQIINILISGVGSVVGTVAGAVASIVSVVATAVVGCIFALYLLSGKEKLGRQLDRLMKCYIRKSRCDKAMHVFSVMNDCFHRYIVGQCTEAVILGILCTLGMLILRLPYATMIGALISATALIPIAGAYIGAGVGAFMIFTVSPLKAVIFLIFIVILQQLEGNLIYPKVVGSSIGLPGIWVLAAVTLGGSLMGIFGMLLAVPLAATAYRLLREDVNKPKSVCLDRETKKNVSIP